MCDRHACDSPRSKDQLNMCSHISHIPIPMRHVWGGGEPNAGALIVSEHPSAWHGIALRINIQRIAFFGGTGNRPQGRSLKQTASISAGRRVPVPGGAPARGLEWHRAAGAISPPSFPQICMRSLGCDRRETNAGPAGQAEGIRTLISPGTDATCCAVI